jgi:hypothetical protein
MNPVVLARYPSKSNPSKSHEVRRGADGVVYCGCPSWRFQKNSPSNRTCKHVEMWKSETLVPGSATVTLRDVLGEGPKAVRAPRKSRKPVSPKVETVAVRHDTVPCPPPVEGGFEEPEWDSRPTSWETVLKNAG